MRRKRQTHIFVDGRLKAAVIEKKLEQQLAHP